MGVCDDGMVGHTSFGSSCDSGDMGFLCVSGRGFSYDIVGFIAARKFEGCMELVRACETYWSLVQPALLWSVAHGMRTKRIIGL